MFNLKERGTTVGREIVAGLTTFLAMTYILAVNPGMLGMTGNGFCCKPSSCSCTRYGS